MATIALTAENFDDIISKNSIVLIDFWASWCGPCRQFGPTFEASSEKHDDIVFAKVDTEAQEKLATNAGIQAIPTVIAYKDGKIVYNKAGVLSAAALDSVIEKIKSGAD